MQRILIIFIALLLCIIYAKDGDRSGDSQVKRKFEFNLNSDSLNVRAEASDSGAKSRLEFELKADRDFGLKLRGKYYSKSSDSRARVEFKAYIRKLVEYGKSTTHEGYKKGVDTVYNYYPGTGSTKWAWQSLVDETPSKSENKTYSIKTSDGVLGVKVYFNVPATKVGPLDIIPDDVKFDIILDVDALKGKGWFVNDTEVAILGVLQSRLKHKVCENENSTGSVCGDQDDGTQGARLRWVNVLDCAGGRKVNLKSDSFDDDAERDNDSDSRNENAAVVVWSLLDIKSVNGSCVWDPQLVLGTGNAFTIGSILLLVLLALF
jgi:hypothetical protein